MASKGDRKGGSARERRTRWVVLGMLLGGPASGYELRQRIAASVGNFWQESFGQLYPTLAELEAEGLIVASAEHEGARERRRFELARGGGGGLGAWGPPPPRPQPERNELLLKVFFAELDPEAAVAHVEAAGRAAAEDAERLAALQAELLERVGGHPSLPAWLATLDYGLTGQRLAAEWSARAATSLRAMGKPGRGRPARGRRRR